MNWNKDKSIVLSQVCVVLFALLLLALDVGGYWFTGWFCVTMRGMPWQTAALMMGTIYAGSAFGWLCLYQLWRLLANIRRGALFVSDNVRCLRIVSWCCVWAAIIAALSAAYYPPFLFIAAAAGFMSLLVRIVKNAFEQAITMKDELDLTV